MLPTLLLLLMSPTAGVKVYNITVGYLEMISTKWDWIQMAPAITLAMKDAKKQGITNRVNFKIVWDFDQCNAKKAVQSVIKWKEKYDLDVVLGPRCTDSCIAISPFTSYWKIPVFTNDCSQDSLGDKSVYEYLTRVGPTSEAVGHLFLEVIQHFGWRRVIMLYDTMYGDCYSGLQHVKKNKNITVAASVHMLRTPNAQQMLEYLREIKENGRVVFLCVGAYSRLMRLLMEADRYGLNNGEYAFFFYYEFPTADTKRPHMTGPAGELEAKRKAVENVKILTLSSVLGVSVDEFLKQLPYEVAQPPWNITKHIEKGNNKTSLITLFLYDATMLYLLVLNETIEEDKDPHDGLTIFEKVKHKEFIGKAGKVKMEEHADRETNYWIWHMKPEHQTFEIWTSVMLTDPPGKRIKPKEKTFWGRTDNSVPPDVPKCGFRNEFCPEDNAGQIALASGLSVGIILIAASVIILVLIQRRKKLEEELQQMTWKVKYEEVEFSKGKGLGSMMWSLKSMSQLSQASSRSSLYYGSHQAGSLGQGQIFTKLALYKGNLVAVRQVHKQTISLERADLLELKLMRDFSHENINPFIGACIEQPNVCVLTQYCPKGSLQDILENGEIKLDAMFKGSLISDLNDGMAYLHNTVLHSHGKLTSGNCLVDSRWVLKVSDYGLHAFKDNTKSDDVGEYEYYRGFLWTAPEIMRMEKKPRNGTQKGDVYSFAIIMQEILFRALPFFLESAPPQDIVDRVRNGELPPFRPEIPKNRPSDVTEGMINLMQVCWQEQEDDRYNFQTIKKQLKAINKGKKFNIMDNMVDKLEKYANNLEDIVEQRTHELLDEKRKTDSLLYRMLPESVANALKAGKAIEAEVFDEVTIYFSDVVGFTSLSSESTPMQVVDLLNDLYSMCDNTIAIYDVYKVETIGDAYMVVSGLPQRNGKKHSMEVANMALDLLSAVSTDFRVRHKPGLTLKLRIGLHTGPCAAGVVGLAMPRYCLFGDSVNMASRMESNGEGFKIHISSATHESLKSHSVFQMTCRGEVALKGKGVQKTYWLLGRDGFNKPLPKVDDSTQP